MIALETGIAWRPGVARRAPAPARPTTTMRDRETSVCSSTMCGGRRADTEHDARRPRLSQERTGRSRGVHGRRPAARSGPTHAAARVVPPPHAPCPPYASARRQAR